MANKKNTRREAGSGSIRQRKDGTWEGRYTNGFDPKTGKPIRRSIYGKTQREVATQLREITHQIDIGTYIAPCEILFGDWLDTWLSEYLTGRSPLTIAAYDSNCRNYIRPVLGKVRLDAITPVMLQKFINGLSHEGLSPKTIKNIHGVVHRALEQAVRIGYLRTNPANVCNLPKAVKPAIQPLTSQQIKALMEELEASHHPFANLYLLTLFTGMRQGEVLGLSWDDIDFSRGTITIRRQLRKLKGRNNGYEFAAPKDGEVRLIQPAPFVMELLERQKRLQEHMAEIADCAWDNADHLVFTNDFGGHLVHVTVYKAFKALAVKLGMPERRFHDLRHTFAVISLENGDDIKTVQHNLGHATASFTLDVYGHVSDRMRRESAARMERFIEQISPSTN